MLLLTRRERFNAAHKLYQEKWSEEKNTEVFGKCANRNWHGHNYELFVTVKGEINEDTGFIIDLKRLSEVLQEKVVEVLDHKNLNLDVPFLKGKMASTEILAVSIWNEIKDDVIELGAQLHSIKLKETENNFVEYFGPTA
ncbi:MAG: 6-pyruvoyltetrahydropterin/6-carboxytetrahydropterin synthase [Saprospiraceae bacterium]|jgi:6-pyruvoyltetrahydropterin/6-carboxytetrahydropterin synthase